jgi:hypothetical protein
MISGEQTAAQATGGSDEHRYRIVPSWLGEDEGRTLGALSVDAAWEQGRQGTGYQKASLLDQPTASPIVERAVEELGRPSYFDAWLLRYPVGSDIPAHTDPALEGLCHVRLNALIVAGAGGMLCLDGLDVPLHDRDAYIFRPDIVEHSVAAIQQGTRLVLSVGANVEYAHAKALGFA